MRDFYSYAGMCVNYWWVWSHLDCGQCFDHRSHEEIVNDVTIYDHRVSIGASLFTACVHVCGVRI